MLDINDQLVKLRELVLSFRYIDMKCLFFEIADIGLLKDVTAIPTELSKSSSCMGTFIFLNGIITSVQPITSKHEIALR